ncbi:hypothetical protein BH11MYX2_BH11MYX2_33300 [soil metagenome]
MSTRALAFCLPLLASVSAEARPSYPVRMPKVAHKKLVALEAEFRAHNTQAWDSVEVDPRGFVTRVITTDPALVPTLVNTSTGPQWSPVEFDRLREFLRSNATLFGLDPGLVEKLRNSGAHLSVDDRLDDAILGAIDVRFDEAPKPRLDIIVNATFRPTPTVTTADVKERLVGARYKQTIGFGAAPRRDCGMMPSRHGNSCGGKTLFTEKHDVTVTAENAAAHALFLRRGDTYRLVACADVMRSLEVAPETVPSDMPAERTLTFNRLAPVARAPKLPLIVDLVTGQVVATTAAGCTEFEITADRD